MKHLVLVNILVLEQYTTERKRESKLLSLLSSISISKSENSEHEDWRWPPISAWNHGAFSRPGTLVIIIQLRIKKSLKKQQMGSKETISNLRLSQLFVKKISSSNKQVMPNNTNTKVIEDDWRIIHNLAKESPRSVRNRTSKKSCICAGRPKENQGYSHKRLRILSREEVRNLGLESEVRDWCLQWLSKSIKLSICRTK